MMALVFRLSARVQAGRWDNRRIQSTSTLPSLLARLAGAVVAVRGVAILSDLHNVPDLDCDMGMP